MKGLTKKVPRTMAEHKSQYIGAALLIALSCLIFSVFNIMGTDLQRNLELFKTDHVQEDASFILKSDLSDLSSWENRYHAVIERRGSADASFADSATLRVLSATEKVDTYAVVKGRGLSGDDDILVDPAFAAAHQVAIGEDVTIFGKSFRVRGYVSTPDYIYPLKNESDMMKDPNAFGIAVISQKAFENLGQGYWYYSVKFQGTDPSALKSALEKSNTIFQWVDKEDNMRISFINGDMSGIRPLGTALPLAILLVTCALTAVVLGRLLRREYTQIGVLRAIGYRRREILRHYLNYPLLIAAAGSAAGTIAGTLLVRPFLAYVSTFYNLPVFQADIQPSAVALSIALPFLLLLPTALIVILRALRMPPLQLIRGGVRKSDINFLERALPLRHVRFTAKFKVREVVRNIPRAALLLAGVVCASALLLLGFALKDSMSSLLGSGLMNTYRYQYVYTFNTLQTQAPADGEPVTLSPFTVTSEGESVAAVTYGIRPDARLIDLRGSDGERLDYSQVIVTKSLADRLGLHSGDTVSVRNKISGKTDTLTVEGIAEFYLGDFIYMPIDRLDDMLGYPQGSYLELDSEKKLDIPASELISVTDRQYLQDSFESILLPIREMAGLIGAAAFAVGLVILYVVLSLLIEENRESISLLKILGYRNRQLYALVLNPYTGFVLLGYMLAVPLVLGSLGAFFHAMTAQMNITIPARLAPADIFFGLVVTAAVYELSKLLNRRKIAAVSMSDSLKNKWE